MDKQATLISMHGVIIPGFLQDTAEVLNLVLAIKGEEDYLIANTEKGRELLGHLRETINVTGKVMIDEVGNKILTVHDYRIMEHFH